MVEEFDGFFIKAQTVGPCSLFFLVSALLPEPLVVTLGFECSFQCYLDCKFLEVGYFIGDGERFLVMGQCVFASIRVGDFFAP